MEEVTIHTNDLLGIVTAEMIANLSSSEHHRNSRSASFPFYLL